MYPAVPWINISGCEEARSARLFPRYTEKREEGRKQEKTVCGLWKPGDWAAQQITSRQFGKESEKYLWKQKEPVRKKQASSVRGGNCATGKLIQEESHKLEKAKNPNEELLEKDWCKRGSFLLEDVIWVPHAQPSQGLQRRQQEEIPRHSDVG